MAFKSSEILKKVIPKLQLPFVSQMCAKWRQGAFRRCKCIKRKLDNNNVWFHTVHLKIRAHLFPQGQQQHWALVCTCEKFGAPMWKCLVQNTSDQMHEADVTWCWEKGILPVTDWQPCFSAFSQWAVLYLVFWRRQVYRGSGSRMRYCFPV